MLMWITILIIFGLIILYWAVYTTLNMPGCTGNCNQGRGECDCPLKKDKE